MTIIICTAIGLYILCWIIESIQEGRCVWCYKYRKLKHLGVHAIGIYYCKPDCCTRDFLNAKT